MRDMGLTWERGHGMGTGMLETFPSLRGHTHGRMFCSLRLAGKDFMGNIRLMNFPTHHTNVHV